MSRKLDYTLTEDQLAELEQAINSSPYPEVRQRSIAIRLLHLGQPPEQVAQVVLVTSNTIYAWHKRWREQGITGLRDGQRTGRPAKADQSYLKELARVLEIDPRTLDLPFTIWTINRLRLYLAEQTGILLSYKAEWHRRELRKIDRWFPSTQLCHVCDYQNTELTLADREWTCPECGTQQRQRH